MRLLKNVASDDKSRQKMTKPLGSEKANCEACYAVTKNRSIWVICEDFEVFFNADLSSAVVLQRPHNV